MKKILLILFIFFNGVFLFACNNNNNTVETNNDKRFEIYELAKNSGYTGTYEEWLDSIKGDQIELRVNNNKLEWKYQSEYSWRFLTSFDKLIGKPGQNGTDGKEIELSTNATHIVWRYKGDSTWKNLLELSLITGNNGADGKSAYDIAVELGFNGTKQEWLQSLIGQNGADGKEIILGTNETHIVWRYKGDTSWRKLLPLTSIQGQNGKSAYQSYIDTHPEYKGTEEEWINDLISGKLQALENQNKLEYVPNVSVLVSKGQQITLPQEVNVYLTNGLSELCSVEWIGVNDLNSNYLGVKTIEGFINKYNTKVTCYLRVVPYMTTENVVDGYVNGLLGTDKALVTLYNDTYLETFETNGNGYYEFNNVPFGSYTLKVDAKGYYINQYIDVTLSKVTIDKNTMYSNVSHNNFDLLLIRDQDYYFGWEKEGNFNTEVGANVVFKDEIVFIENKGIVVDLGYASFLREKYNVILTDDGIKWSTETINRFYELYQTIPTTVTDNLKSVWTLVPTSIQNDISFEFKDGVFYVKLSKEAITNSTPRVATVNGEKGKYFSKRLYNAMIRFVTNNGTNASACETILTTNFLTSFNVPDYVALTKGITNEDETQFQEFLPEEKIQILTMFEEMPEGMHKMKELKYLVRRKTGQSHPIYPDAAAVTWTKASVPYIEFMDKSFGAEQGYYHTKRLIIHEKTHMLWEHYFSQTLKDEWCKVGGWYEDPDDPDGWSTTKQTEFVSAYAHQHNPDEDMAESVATFVINPNLLKSRSINKYNFIKNYIMNGSIYLTQIREDLTFEVYNLNPDYTYPGQIKKIEVNVSGDKYDDKLVKFRMELLAGDGFSGATGISFRINPVIKDSTQMYDVGLAPIDSTGLVLEGSVVISKHSYSGYWFTDQITIYDAVGNERYESNTDFTMKIFIDNPLYDDIPVKLVRNTLKLSLENANNLEHPTAQNLIVEFDYKENIEVRRILVRLYCKKSTKSDSIDIDAKAHEIDRINQKVRMKVYIPEHYPSGLYEISEISFTDIAGNGSFYHVDYGTLVNENNTINITNTNPDYVGPTLDVNNIKITAVPSNPQSPNGETFVTLKLTIKDDISGFNIGYLRLLDPQGIQHGYWLYGPNYTASYFNGDPTVNVEYTFKVTLPKGSAPGTWGIYEISLTDHALNSQVYDFTETIHFDVIK